MESPGNTQDLLRRLPSVERMLARGEIQELLDGQPRSVVVNAVRAALEQLRQGILEGQRTISDAGLQISDSEELMKDLIGRARASVGRAAVAHPVRVINATGIIVHTGLGRSLLSERAIAGMTEAARYPCALEVDIETGERGHRDSDVARLLRELTGAEAATVVNNNAAAVLLTLNALAEGKEVIVSRGQLVEIGGSFRIPEVIAKSGARLVEVGTTNKTRVEDYRKAVGDDTAAILRVHSSNFRIVGFTEEASLDELVDLAREFQLPVIDDLGSGAFVDLSPYGLRGEPRVQDSVMAGASVITFSGDKLLGGPQSGLIIGRAEYVGKIRRNPLYRAVRVDKFTLAALTASLQSYLDEETAWREIPTLAAISRNLAEVQRAAQRLKRAVLRGNPPAAVSVEKGFSQVGGGALPTENIETRLVALQPTAITVDELARRLRTGSPSVFCRIQNDKVLLDLRTVAAHEIRELAEAVCTALT